MQSKAATTILDSLVRGRDPISGEELPPDSVLQRAPVIRALLVANEAIKSVTERQARRNLLPKCVGKPWTQEEEERLSSAYKAGASISALAKEHLRTERAIEARLIRLGLRHLSDAAKEPFLPT